MVRSSILFSLLRNQLFVSEAVKVFRPFACDSNTSFSSMYHTFKIPTPSTSSQTSKIPISPTLIAYHTHTCNSLRMKSPSFTGSVLSNFPIYTTTTNGTLYLLIKFAIVSLLLSATWTVATSVPSSSGLR